jgi:hypothetical protein
MNQDYGTTRAFDHKVQTRAVNGDEFGERFRIPVSSARSDVSLPESSGNAHKNNLFTQRRQEAKTRREIRRLRSVLKYLAPNGAAACSSLFQFGGYYLLASLDEGEKDLVTFSN